ncbi:histidine phosphatase family protein [Candidatus Azambacteria bacterium]|nr:histidine phosphatase family protein [Candidatus Azambacteria bacterium]
MERFNPETKEKREQITSAIDLRFFRHAEKESDKSKSDEEIELTETGRKQTVEKSEDRDISQSVAFGSPRKRTQQTAGLVMGGQLDEITGNENIDELKEKLNKELKVGSKIGVDKRLDFNIDFSTDFGKKALESVKNGEYLKFLVEESDALAESFKDSATETYSGMAGRVAEIVKKYLTVAPRWDKLAQDESKKHEDTLKRFLGTHQGIGESFLAKVIEETKGKAERDAFVSALNNQGFDFAEGFDVEIQTSTGENQKVRISFKKEKDGETIFEYDEIVPKEMIESLILSEIER